MSMSMSIVTCPAFYHPLAEDDKKQDMVCITLSFSFLINQFKAHMFSNCYFKLHVSKYKKLL